MSRQVSRLSEESFRIFSVSFFFRRKGHIQKHLLGITENVVANLTCRNSGRKETKSLFLYFERGKTFQRGLRGWMRVVRGVRRGAQKMERKK